MGLLRAVAGLDEWKGKERKGKERKGDNSTELKRSPFPRSTCSFSSLHISCCLEVKFPKPHHLAKAAILLLALTFFLFVLPFLLSLLFIPLYFQPNG